MYVRRRLIYTIILVEKFLRFQAVCAVTIVDLVMNCPALKFIHFST